MNVNSPIFVPMRHVPPPVPPVPSMYVMYDVPPPQTASTVNPYNQYAAAAAYGSMYQSQMHQMHHEQHSRYIYNRGMGYNGSGMVSGPVPYYMPPQQFTKRPLITKEEVEYMLLFQQRYRQTSRQQQKQQPQMQVDDEQNDTLQRDGSKASHATQRNDEKDSKNDNKTDGSLTVKCQKQKSARNGQKQKNLKSSDSYQKKTAQENHKAFDSLLITRLDRMREMDFASNAEYFASGTEESIINRHSPEHRNSSSSASDLASTSDDVNSVSSREDLSDTYDLVKGNKKAARSRRNRKQRRQQQQQPDQQQQSQQKQKQSRSSSKSSSSETSSPTPPSALNNASQQQKSNKTSRKTTGKENITAAAQQQQQPQKTANKFRLKPQSNGVLLPSSSSTSPSTSAASSVSSSPTASPKAKRIGKIRHMIESPFSLVDVLSEFEIATYLRQYIPDAKKLRNFGYPVESATFEGCIEIYKSFPRFYAQRLSTNRPQHIGVVNPSDGLKSFTMPTRKLSSGDSGKGSGSSTPLSYNGSPADSDYSEEENVTDLMYSQIVEKSCIRCKKPFKVSTNGEYITREPCHYHWGKQEATGYTDERGDASITYFSCCKKTPAEPCTKNHVHVWTDISSGLNGPYTDFVHTQPKRRVRQVDSESQVKIYALDCEMSYTGLGMEVTKVTVIAYNGKMVYETIVHPRSEVGDYNTRFSGVSEKDFEPGSDARTLETVQTDLLDLIDADDILIGHALENDLRSLRIVHKRIVDTSIIYPHPNGFPFRRGLKSIVAAELGRDIQVDEAGHSSYEDSQACLELMLLKVRAEYKAKSTKKPKLPLDRYVISSQRVQHRA